MQLEVFFFFISICSFLPEDVRKIIKKSEFYQTIDYNCLYFTIHEAVVIAQELNQQVGVCKKIFVKYVSMLAQAVKIRIVTPNTAKTFSTHVYLSSFNISKHFTILVNPPIAT